MEAATVRLSAAADVTRTACYAGPPGTRTPCTSADGSGRSASYRGGPLSAGDALTVVAAFPVGSVATADTPLSKAGRRLASARSRVRGAVYSDVMARGWFSRQPGSGRLLPAVLGGIVLFLAIPVTPGPRLRGEGRHRRSGARARRHPADRLRRGDARAAHAGGGGRSQPADRLPAAPGRDRSGPAEAFAGHWGSPPPDPDRWRHWYTGSRAFRPEISLLVLDGAEVAAYLLTYFYAADAEATGIREARVGQLGTRARWRRRGLGTLLLTAALAAYRDAGYQRASLGVDTENPTGALGLYRRVGFVVDQRSVTSVKPIGRDDPRTWRG